MGDSDDVFRLDPGDRAPLLDQVRTVARSQLDAALAAVNDPGDDVAEAVHTARKCCKKLRGLARLVRPGLDESYGEFNVVVRDAARQLGSLRDAHALAESFDELVVADQRTTLDLGPVAAELHRRSAEASEHVRNDAPQLAEAAVGLRRAAAMVETWSWSAVEDDVLTGGIAKTFARGRTALEECRRCPTTEAFHQYRKRTKYTWYHLRLLEASAPAVLGPRVGAFDELSDLLGDEHDLAVLAALLVNDEAFVDHDSAGGALFVIGGRRSELQRAALRLGDQLHAEPSQLFAESIVAQWSAHRPG